MANPEVAELYLGGHGTSGASGTTSGGAAATADAGTLR
jgi:hypothetical protein